MTISLHEIQDRLVPHSQLPINVLRDKLYHVQDLLNHVRIPWHASSSKSGIR